MINFLILGSSQVGKTSLVNRFSNDSFSDSYQPTTCTTSEYKAIEYNHKTINLQLWDTFENNFYDLQAAEYFARANGVILVFAIDDRASFDKISNWMDLVQKNCKKDISIVLVGNKIDAMSPTVTIEEVENRAQTYGLKYYELSAKENTNMNEPFLELVRQHEVKNKNKQSENAFVSEIKEYLNAFKAEIYSQIEESRRNDKQELKASLHELQIETKTLIERISQIEKRNKIQVGDNNPVPNSLEDEIAELKQRIQESEDRMTNTFYQIDHRLRTMTPNIMKESNVKFLDPNHLYSPLSRGGKFEHEFPKIVEEDLTDSELKRVQSEHLQPVAKASNWRGRFDLTIKTPDSTTPKNRAFSIVDGLDDEHKNYRTKVHNYVNSESILKDQTTPRKAMNQDDEDGVLSETSYENKPNNRKSLHSRYMSSHLEGNVSFNEPYSPHRMEVNPIPSIQEEIGLIWKTINTVIENTHEQIENLKISIENKPMVMMSPRLEASSPTDPKKEDQSQDKETNKEEGAEKPKGIYEGKDLKTILREVKDDVHNQILGVQREFDRELLALRDTLLGHYTTFSEKIGLDYVGVKKYIDDALEYIKAELHEVMDNNHNQIMTREDRSMSDGNILAKFIQRPDPYNINLDTVSQQANQSKQAEKDKNNNFEQIQKQNQALTDGLMKSLWETINLIASRLQKVEKNLNTPPQVTAAPAKGKVK